MLNRVALWVFALAALLIAACGQSAESEPVSEPIPSETAKEVEIGSDIGNRLPNFDLTLTDNGEKLTSASLLDSGRPAFLFFFATT